MDAECNTNPETKFYETLHLQQEWTRKKLDYINDKSDNLEKSLKWQWARQKNRHNIYAIRYWFCECLCLVNILFQLYVMNKFFDGEFMSYGLRVMNFSETAQEDRVDPMVYVFPRVTKCIFHKYGASGSIQKHDSLCILPLNIVNEKTYIFIWFWFMILATFLSFLVLYRILIIALPKIRPRIMHAKHSSIPIEVCEALTRKVDLGDWWVLLMLGSNMDSMYYREIIMSLTKSIDSNGSNQLP